MAKLLEKNKIVSELHIDHNKIGDEGALALAEALRKNIGLNQSALRMAQTETWRKAETSPTRLVCEELVGPLTTLKV